LADEQTFVLARDPETIRIKEILDCVKNSGKKMKARTDLTDEESEIDDLLVEVDQSVAEALDDKHLQRLIRSLPPPARGAT
jgi:DNA-binding IscR family transcriptional regulator